MSPKPGKQRSGTRLEVIYVPAKHCLSTATLNTTQKALRLVSNTITCRVCFVSKPLNAANLFEPCRYDDGAKPGSSLWGERGRETSDASRRSALHSPALQVHFIKILHIHGFHYNEYLSLLF